MKVNPNEWAPSGINDLEPAAWSALKESQSSAVVVAGPGAGKTEFLAQKVAYLLQTGLCKKPYKILAISFKKDAAENLKNRVQQRCGPELSQQFVSLTFDSFTKSLLDRFFPALPDYLKPSYPYEISYPGYRDIQTFFDETRASAEIELKAEIVGITQSTFEMLHVGQKKMPEFQADTNTGLDYAIDRWWKTHLKDGLNSRLTFLMINRLSEALLRLRPQILQAVRVTYPFVFLDEFQDTTYAQYDFLKTAFFGGKNLLTAVGDNKQRIMTWAGAKPDAFAQFQKDFKAKTYSLTFNFRSSPDLVLIQHIVARALDSNSIDVKSQSSKKINDEVAAIWSFDSEHHEASHIAGWIKSDIIRRQTAPRDYAILIKQKADQYEEQLKKAISAVGLRIRNESKYVGPVTLQDLLTEEITKIAISIIKLSCYDREPSAWNIAFKAIMHIRGVSSDELKKSRLIENDLLKFVNGLREELPYIPPSEDSAHHISTRIFDFINPNQVKGAFIQYYTGDLLSMLISGFEVHLVASAANSKDWKETIDNFEGNMHIPLMTVHKSKGLEYDTIIFIGLEDNAWWSHRPGNKEGLATFFVALSRAKQRVIFTIRKGQTREKVSDLYQLLHEANVLEINC